MAASDDICVCVHARDDAGLTCIDAQTMTILLAALVAPVWIPVHATTRFHPSSHGQAHVEKQHSHPTTQGTIATTNNQLNYYKNSPLNDWFIKQTK